MSGTDPSSVTFARALSTLGCGINAGLQLSVAIWTMPSLYMVKTLAPRDRLHFALGIYKLGAKTIPPLALASLAAASYAAIVAKSPAAYLPSNFWSRNRKALLALTALASLGPPLFTVAFMKANINEMLKAEQEIEKDPETANGKYDLDGMVEKWLKQHSVRVAFGVSAFLFAVLELANA